jgi:hypothetical protein
MDIYMASDIAKELGISESEFWRAYNAATTPEATIRRQRRREAARPDGAIRYVPVSLAGHVLQNPDAISRKVVLFKDDTN